MPTHATSCEASESHPRRASLTVADIIRQAVDDGFAERPLPPQHAAVLRTITRCRTADMGGHVHVCRDCRHVEYAYNSCGNRHCPTCQWRAQQRWIASRLKRVLDTHYFHVVFTLPDSLHALALANPREIYGLLFKAASRTLIELGRDPKWLGADLGITMVLHTWTRDLRLHPHVHCIVTGGGLSEDDEWVDAPSSFLFPVHVIGALFRGKFMAGLESLHRRAELTFDGAASELAAEGAFARLVGELYDKKWIVYSKRPMAGAEQVITYLGRYTHRVAISDSRLLEVTDCTVRFRTRGRGTAELSREQFVRRFLLHVLPKGFVKIRHYGLFAPSNVNTRLPIAASDLEQRHAGSDPTDDDAPDDYDDLVQSCEARCSACGSTNLHRIPFTAAQADSVVRSVEAFQKPRGPPLPRLVPTGEP